MRKAIAWLCFVLMLCAAIPGLAQEPTATINDGPTSVQRGTSVTIATPNQMSGSFSTDLFGNNTADMDVRNLIHGYETVAWTSGGALALNNTVVSSLTTEEIDGAVLYTLTLADNLTYNDGTPITAKDYAFYFLLHGAPQIEEIGGTTQGLNHIIGYDAYQLGQSNIIDGVRLVSDKVLEIYVDSNFLPYFYELVFISARPYPISVIAPGCEVKDDGSGIYLSGNFSADMLRQTLLNAGSGYLSNPQVTSGPYTLEAYDSASNTATFVVNDRFVGNYQGQKPVIERIMFQYAPEEDINIKLRSGEVDIGHKLGDIVAINEDIQANESSLFSVSYLRSGFAFLSFACEEIPTDSAAVRKAISMAIDKAGLVEETMPNFAARVDGYCGLGQWMTTYIDDGATTGKAALNAYEELLKYAPAYDLAGAEALLGTDGWVYNQDGQEFQAGTDDVRYKKMDETLVPLEINWALTNQGPYIGALRTVLESVLPQMGIKLTVTELDFPTLLSHYYRQTDRTYNMFYMASNFGYVFDPYYDFNTAEEYQGIVNTTGLRDDDLMNLARNMRETESTDLRSYVDRWLAFQERFAELMPMIPLYSNVYYERMNGRIQNYDIVSRSSWAHAILYAYIAE